MLHLPEIESRPASGASSSHRSLFSRQPSSTNASRTSSSSTTHSVPTTALVEDFGNLSDPSSLMEPATRSFSMGDECFLIAPPDEDGSAWHRHAEEIRTRPRGWIKRYAAQLTEADVFTPPLTASEEKQQRLLRSGWSNTLVPRTAFAIDPEPIGREVDLIPYPSMASRMHNCVYCCRKVAVGSEYVICQHCPVIAHLNCVPDVDAFIQIRPSYASNRPPPGILKEKSNRQLIKSPSQKRLSFNPDLVIPATRQQELFLHGLNSGSRRVSISSSSTMQSPGKNVNITSNDLCARDVRWTCAFCRDDLQASKSSLHEREEERRILRKLMHSCVRLQSFCRMATWRMRYLKCLRGIKQLQNVIRLRRMVKQNEAEKANERYTYRICLHSLTLLAPLIHGSADHDHRLPGNSAGSSHPLIGVPILPKPFVMGEMNSVSFDRLCAALTTANVGSSNGSISSATTANNSVSTEGSSLVNFSSLTPSGPDGELMMSHLMIGLAELPGSNYARSYRNIQTLPRGTIFLIVSVHEYPSDYSLNSTNGPSVQNNGPLGTAPVGIGVGSGYRAVQLVRYDMLMKEDQGKGALAHQVHGHGGSIASSSTTSTGNVFRPRLAKLKPSALNRLGYRDLSADTADYLCKNYGIAKLCPARPWLLIPYSRANAEVRLTVCEVRDWPKCLVLGQATQPIRYYITRRRVVSITHSLQACHFSDVPAQDDGSRLSLTVPKPASPTNRSPSRVRRDTISSRSGTRSAQSQNDGSDGHNGDRENQTITYAHGLVTWTLATLGYSDLNGAGFIQVLNQEAVSSTKKKYWCVLLDKNLYVYNVVRDSVQTKFVLDVRTAYVQALPQDVFRVKFNTETLYFLPLSKREHESWFRKFYLQSQSNNTVPYSLYIKRRLPPRAPSHSQLPHSLQNSPQIGARNRSRSQSSASESDSISPSRSPTSKQRRKSSAEEVELVSLEVDVFLEQMKREYLDYQADRLPGFGPLKNSSRQHQSGNVQVETRITSGTLGMGLSECEDFSSYLQQRERRQQSSSSTAPASLEVSTEASQSTSSGSSRKPAPSPRNRNNRLLSRNNSNSTVYSVQSHNFAARMAQRSTAILPKNVRKPGQALEMLDTLSSTVIQARSIF